MDYINYKDTDTSVYHDLINIEMGYDISVPHEWYFLNLLTRQEIKKNREIASMLVRFILEYYPEYSWTAFNSADLLATVVVESELCSYLFLQKYKYQIPVQDVFLEKAMKFGDIVTDFLIRYQNYSLIKCSGQNIIITARSDCHKRFEELLSRGYSIQRKAKIYYNRGFYKLPVLPTRDIAYPFEEFIETENGNYQKIIQNNIFRKE